MDEREILRQLSSRLGLSSLNIMQRAMSDAVGTDAPSYVLLSPTGSGKTIAFTVAMLKKMGKPEGVTRCVVIVPSRELAIQVGDVIKTVANGYRVLTFYGGHSVADEVRSLAVTPDIIVSTPGRLLDHVNRHHVNMRDVRIMILDEYDKSLELGFADEMSRIVKAAKSVKTLILTSATAIAAYPDYMDSRRAVVLDFNKPVEDKAAAMPEKPAVLRLMSWERDKLPVLGELMNRIGEDGPAMVFVNYRESADRVYDYLKRQKIPVGLYHGGLEQRERENALEMFRNGTTPVLVTTDLGSRGLDIPTVGSVIHYHLPLTPEVWTHRNGRTGRLGGLAGNVYVITAEDETIPPCVVWDREYHIGRNDADRPFVRTMTTLYINAGRREKISKGDIVGYLTNKGGLDGKDIGRIELRDHCALVAIPASLSKDVIKAVSPHKIKNTRVKISLL